MIDSIGWGNVNFRGFIFWKFDLDFFLIVKI